MKRLILTAAVLLAALAPAQAHSYTHWQWGQSGCYPGVWWAFGDQTEWPSPASQSGNASIARHNRNYHYAPTAQTWSTEGAMEEFFYFNGSECGWLGRVDGPKEQWIDSGHLVHRQRFRSPNGAPHTVQIVFPTTCYCIAGSWSVSVS